MANGYPVYEISENHADSFFSSHPDWASYAQRDLRELAGLRVYFFLDSY